jgi:pyruvate/2-oxoglutarate dehydrogenase complex dihydrolipoamide dehydrogenase (E3) component
MIDSQQLTAQQLYLNLGARASRPPIPGLETVDAMTEVELLALNSLPEHLVIIGGGYIGLEFGQMFRRFGARVTIIAGSRVAPREDEDIAAILSEVLTAEGVDIALGRPVQLGPAGAGVKAELGDGTTIEGSHLLLATGPALQLRPARSRSWNRDR